MLAVYLSIVKGLKVALVERGSEGSIRQAEVILGNIGRLNTRKILKRISIHTCHEASEVSSVTSKGYDYVIIDYGCEYSDIRQEFLMCQIKIVIGSLSWWQIPNYAAFMANMGTKGCNGHWAYLGTFVVHRGLEYLKHEFRIKIRSVPYEPDPFCLRAESLDFFEKLILEYF